MEYIGKGIGTIALAIMVIGVAKFAPQYLIVGFCAVAVIGLVMWAN